jgi:hypothetical protein
MRSHAGRMNRVAGPLPVRCLRSRERVARGRSTWAPPWPDRSVTVSRPVGGVLCPRSVAGPRVVAIHLSGPPGDALRGERAGTHVPGSALLPMGVASRPGRPGRWCALTAPFHPCLCGVAPAIGGLLSVARSARSPPPGSRQHRALWSPDLPRRTHEGCAAATRPAHRHDQSGPSRTRPARSIAIRRVPLRWRGRRSAPRSGPCRGPRRRRWAARWCRAGRPTLPGGAPTARRARRASRGAPW